MITKGRLLATVLIALLTLMMAGCATSFEEWSGNMSNETGRHVKPYDENQTGDENQSILLVAPLSVVTTKCSARDQNAQCFRPAFTPSLVAPDWHSVARAPRAKRTSMISTGTWR